MTEADEDLIAKSRRGDRAAFEELVRRTARLVYARAYLETGDVHRAEDLAQETFLIAWRSISQVSDASGFRPWLMSILHSAVIDSVRRDGRKKRKPADGKPRATDAAIQMVDGAPSPAQSAERKEERARALSAMRSLPDEYRQVLTLRYLAGADYESISRQLALSNGSLRGLLHRGIAMLRKQMSEKNIGTKEH